MSEAKHTPGPWVTRHVMGDHEITVDVYAEHGDSTTFIAECGARSAEARANASLIAAAPELLQVARQVEYELANRGPDVWFPPHVRIALKAAIAKAEGR